MLLNSQRFIVCMGVFHVYIIVYALKVWWSSMKLNDAGDSKQARKFSYACK